MDPDAAWNTRDVVEPSPATLSVRLVTARSQGAFSQKPGTSSSAAGHQVIIPPNMFLAPGYSPRSTRSTLAPRCASPIAALDPAGPAPTTMASNASASGRCRAHLATL